MRISKIIYKLFHNKYSIKISRILKNKYFGWRVRSQCSSCGRSLYVGAKTDVTNYTIIGNNVNFNGMEITGNGIVRIGDYFHSGKNCHIITHIHNYDNGDAIPYDNKILNKDVIIGDFVWLGEGVTILGGVIIEEGAIIQAYSTVVSNIPRGAIAGGHPAKIFKYRNMDHFDRLKKEGKFN